LDDTDDQEPKIISWCEEIRVAARAKIAGQHFVVGASDNLVTCARFDVPATLLAKASEVCEAVRQELHFDWGAHGFEDQGHKAHDGTPILEKHYTTHNAAELAG
jgi:hypothetical protein